MHEVTTLLFLTVAAALIFDYINGFHDTANAIATVVSTHVLTPRTAILMAAVLNFLGAFYSRAVATTIAKGLVHPGAATQSVVLAAIIGAIVWNLITWKYGIPSSSSHALIGGLIGAAVLHGAAQPGTGSVVQWTGVWEKVIIPLVGSPVMGFILANLLMRLIYRLLGRVHPNRVGKVFRRLQIFSAAFMAFTHGANDAQKSMGIITMALVSAHYLKEPVVPTWVIVSCAVAMALGTSAGGWRIMKTMGHRIVRLQPVHGFAVESAAATVILIATHFKMPVSTTHTIAGSIFGVGTSRRVSAVRWQVAQSMAVAWVLTLPAAALVSGLIYLALRYSGLP